MKLIITIPIFENIAGVLQCRESGWTDEQIIELLQEEYGIIEDAEYELIDETIT